MSYNPDLHHRRSIRLRGYDYSRPGAYFLTICTHHRECLFGVIADGKMVLNDAGWLVCDEWIKTAKIRDEIQLDKWVVIPNHFHGILIITRRGTARRDLKECESQLGTARRAPTIEQFGKPVTGSVPTIIRVFKSAVTKRINELRRTPGARLWQQNYWEHIIRKESELNEIRQYIQNNPAQWKSDRLYHDHESSRRSEGLHCLSFCFIICPNPFLWRPTVNAIAFDPEICAACETIDCLMKCQYIVLADLAEARREKQKINAGQDCRVLHECLTCYACQEYCPHGNNPFFVLVDLQEKLGLLPAPRPIIAEQLRMMDFKGRLTKAPVSAPLIDMCAFPMLTGCIRGRLFEGASVICGNDVFCNVMWLHFAGNSVIRERVPRAIDNIMSFYLKDAKFSDMVCFHDECYGTYTSLARAFGIEVPFQPIHLFDYINKRLDDLADRIKPLNQVIAYQRPCSNRLCPETDAVLDEIFRKIGAVRAPRRYDRENALCCGGVPRAHQRDEFADDLLEKNISDMLAVKAVYCVFNCPFCMATMAQEVAERGLMPILVSDLVQVALGE